ncbi:uncharacterized protein SOCG_02346 [Schizosaccharomyces octosporus yFS286]|uniref:Uncharacterized protein n=1 Tax=Schizosaccharomyces octosporus (strain yFS286) TaxID=483514 RepID=S9R9M4_SCHOY|nr:uncharacterized protein SOCG_02346 [Schizosaccharomyces octosporus yFS286]EPX74865.1 hypothetical protein SOCG_02346 [Schizosaccharomyces octosporus yFS286]
MIQKAEPNLQQVNTSQQVTKLCYLCKFHKPCASDSPYSAYHILDNLSRQKHFDWISFITPQRQSLTSRVQGMTAYVRLFSGVSS